MTMSRGGHLSMTMRRKHLTRAMSSATNIIGHVTRAMNKVSRQSDEQGHKTSDN